VNRVSAGSTRGLRLGEERVASRPTSTAVLTPGGELRRGRVALMDLAGQDVNER